MQVHSSSPYSILASHSQLPYNPDMFASAPAAPQPPQSPQYTLQSDAPQPGSEDMFFALERLLMGISPFPPSIPTLAKPTCPPSLDDQLMAEISSTTAPSAGSPIPSIVLNEQSLDLLQQFYQSQDNTQMNGAAFQLPQYESSDCSSSTSRSASPPSSPYSYASSLVSSPAMPVLDSTTNATIQDPYWLSSSNGFVQPQQPQSHNQEWDISLFDQMSLPLTMTDLENYVSPAAASLNANGFVPTIAQQTHSLKQATTASGKRLASAVKKAHHRRTSSVCSALSAYETPAALREHRASSISSVCSSSSAATAAAVAAVTATSGVNSRVKSYACPTCTKPFPTRTQLKSHMAIHTDSFPFPCLYAGCELHFKRKHDLRRHVDAKHALVKKYICTGGCGEGFGRRDQMVRHLRRGTCGQAGFQTE